MFTGGLSDEAGDFINSLDDIIEREQYIDFFRGHTFRQVIFCRKKIELNRRIEPAVLQNFLFNSQMRPATENFDLLSTKFETFTGVKGDSIDIDQPLAKAALFYLGQIRARSVSFFEMLEAGRQRLVSSGYKTENWQTEFETASEILLQICCQTNLIKIHLRQSQAAESIGEKPKISDFARWQLLDSTDLLSLRNVSIALDGDYFTLHLLGLLDGTRDRLQLLLELKNFTASNGEIQSDNLSERLDATLEQLLRIGMFTE